MAGRKNVYDTNIKPYIDKVKEWRKVGATVENMCDILNVSKATFFKYLKEKEEFADAYKKGTIEFCMDLRGELARIAFKHTLETKKQYITEDEDGNKRKHTEITTKEVDGDIAAINLLLKNLDKDWANDPKMLDLKQQELELRKQMAEMKEW